jgi:uncharacterized protein with PQ loop repeat
MYPEEPGLDTELNQCYNQTMEMVRRVAIIVFTISFTAFFSWGIYLILTDSNATTIMMSDSSDYSK